MLHAYGYVGTSGAPFIDYFITDGVVTPADDTPLFTEKLIRLPHCYIPVSHPAVHSGSRRSSASRGVARRCVARARARSLTRRRAAAALAAVNRDALRAQLGVKADAILLVNFNVSRPRHTSTEELLDLQTRIAAAAPRRR